MLGCLNSSILEQTLDALPCFTQRPFNPSPIAPTPQFNYSPCVRPAGSIELGIIGWEPATFTGGYRTNKKGVNY